jgi:hypothetical protein
LADRHAEMGFRSAFGSSWKAFTMSSGRLLSPGQINPLKPELNPSAQRCLTTFFTGDFAS